MSCLRSPPFKLAKTRDVPLTPPDTTKSVVSKKPREAIKPTFELTVTPRDVTQSSPPLRSPGVHIKQEMEDSPAHDVIMSAHDVTMAVRNILLPSDDALDDIVKTEPASIKIEELLLGKIASNRTQHYSTIN